MRLNRPLDFAFFPRLPFCESVILLDLNATRRQPEGGSVGRSYRSLSLSGGEPRPELALGGARARGRLARATRPRKRRGSDTSCAGAESRATVWCWRGALHGEGGGGNADVTPPIPEGGRGLSRGGGTWTPLFPLPLLPRPLLPLSSKCHSKNRFQISSPTPRRPRLRSL